VNPTVLRCPHLYGLNLDGDGFYAYPSSGNCCSRRRPERSGFLFWRRELPPLVDPGYQEEYCLSGRYESCTLCAAPPDRRPDRPASNS
jgi:hypothetical protein